MTGGAHVWYLLPSRNFESRTWNKYRAKLTLAYTVDWLGVTMAIDQQWGDMMDETEFGRLPSFYFTLIFLACFFVWLFYMTDGIYWRFKMWSVCFHVGVNTGICSEILVLSVACTALHYWLLASQRQTYNSPALPTTFSLSLVSQ